MEEQKIYDLVKYKRPLTAAEIRAQVNLIQEVMSAVMKDKIHYGIIPGTPKPTLYKAGAEKLLSTFRIAADPNQADICDLSGPDEIRYRVRVVATSQEYGTFLGAGVGECSSNEEKYKWRKPVCNEEFDETPEDKRREVWKKYDGKLYKVKQIRTNPADVANTVLLMAVKRALVAVTRVVTACSDVFDQDIEDMPEELRESLTENGKKKEPLKEPQKKAKPTDQPDPPQVKDPDAPSTEPQHKAIYALLGKLGIKDDLAKHEKVTALAGIDGETITSMTALNKGQASEAIKALSAEVEGK
jgi:hypothetical protein